MSSSSSNFGRAGYLSLKEYVEDIESVRKNGPWKLPLGIGDRLHIFFLKMVLKFSWFSSILYVSYSYQWSPAYSILVAYLQKRGFIDEIGEKNVNYKGYFFFSLRKNIFINEYNKPIVSFGVDRDRATAFSKTIGESIERLVSGLYNKDKNILIASPNDITKKFPTLYPPKYHRFLDIQRERYRELQYHSENLIDWMSGRNLITKEKTYIPRHIVSWFGFAEARVFMDILLHPTSNGCAGYFTKTGAVLRGLLEVIQRDAFLVHWLTQIAPQYIGQETLPKGIQEKIEEFKTRGISLHILDTTALDVPSVALVAMNSQSETPQIVVSGASATTFAQAIEDGLREMVLMSAYMFYRGGNPKTMGSASSDPKPFISDVNEETRQLYWRGPERIRQFQWFISGKPVSYDELCKQNLTSATDDTAKLRACLNILKERGHEYYPIVYFPKHPIQKELGFYVAQVYIPKAFPLYLLECQGTFDSDRLQEFAASKNVEAWELNPLPHMFP